MEGLIFGVLRYLVKILAVKERFERFSCLEFVFEKSKHREAGLKTSALSSKNQDF